jgi:hypothetical protein
MEANEQPTSDVDLGAEAPDDPFKEIPPDPLADEDLPPGVLPGKLEGDNPSEEDEEPQADPGEFLEEPDEPDDADEDPAPVEEPEPEPEAEPEEETPKAEEIPEPEPDKPEPKAKPKTKAKSKAKKSKPSKTKKENGPREYMILREGAEAGQWHEAFQGEPVGEPFFVEARNANLALKAAYELLSEAEQSPEEYMLICVPRSAWRVRKVAGQVRKQTSISIG